MAIDAPSEQVVFITTLTSDAPNGRNAKVRARILGAELTNPAKPHTGRFSSFQVGHVDGDLHNGHRARNRGKRCQHLDRRSKAESIPVMSLSNTPSTQLEDFRDIITAATYQVQQSMIRTAFDQPSDLVYYLRYRQWCRQIVSDPPTKPSPALRSALTCVQVKVEQVVSGSTSSTGALTEYAHALSELRAAIEGPQSSTLCDAVLATRLLALYEMLYSPDGEDWSKHLGGATTLLKLSMSGGADQSLEVRPSHVSPILLDAILQGHDTVMKNEPLQAVVSSVLEADDLNHAELAGLIMSVTVLLSEIAVTSRAEHKASHGIVTDLLPRVMDLRRSLIEALRTHVTGAKHQPFPSPMANTLEIGLACLLTLDRIVSELEGPGPGSMLQSVNFETQELFQELLNLPVG